MTGTTPLALLAIALAIGGLVWLYRRDTRLARARRSRLFSECLGLFQTCRVVQDGPDYPVLSGRYQGFEIRLEPVMDDMAWRKVPSLWLKATVLAPSARRGVFDLIMRPQGVEFYSPSGDLQHRVRTPAGWPMEAVICTDDPASMPDLDLIGPHIGLFEDPRMKELLITPRGTRLVRQVWQADRARYAVLRQAEFPGSILDPALARSLLDSAIAIWRSVGAAEPMLKAG